MLKRTILVPTVCAVLVGAIARPLVVLAQDGATGAAAADANRQPPPRTAATVVTAPFALDDPDRIEKGRIRFGANCAAYCHGFEGSGGKTPAFRGRKDLAPEDVFKTITEGRVGSDVMPPWNGFSDEKRWELVAYIMYLTRQPPR